MKAVVAAAQRHGQMLLFITSVNGTADLSSWADAGVGNTGLAAGNAICQARATAAGLPGTYRAWISTSTTDAYCNVIGLSGKKGSVSCGGVSPPLAGPWVRTDGSPFAPTIDLLTSNPWIVYTPLNLNEFGNLVSVATYTANFTNTDAYGVMFGGGYTACTDWTDGTSAIVAMVGGETPLTSSSWATGYGYNCNDASGRLLCMQTGAGIPLPAVATTGKKVFVTSTTHNGNLSGLAGADVICAARATAGGLSGTFKAWLSDGTHNAVGRLTSNGPWVRPDGVMVAKDKTALTTNGLLSGLLFASISQDENGNYVSTATWTGTNSDGTKGTNTCNNWTDDTVSSHGMYGATYTPNLRWTQSSADFTCDSSQPIYCFEDD